MHTKTAWRRRVEAHLALQLLPSQASSTSLTCEKVLSRWTGPPPPRGASMLLRRLAAPGRSCE